MRGSILGAGPAGLSAAINLAKEGFQVDVYERNEVVGKRFNGDLQGLENWTEKEDILRRLKKMNIKLNFNYTPFKKLSLSSQKKFWNFYLDRSAFYLVRRGPMEGTFDYGLREQALDCGVNIHFGETINEELADVVATGPIPQEKFAVARVTVFETDMDDIALAIVNNNVALNGYSYLLVAEGHGTISTVSCGDYKHLNQCYSNTHKFLTKIMDLTMEKIHESGGMGCFSSKNIFQSGECLYVGEAAGIQDFLWGFGMRRAVVSGFLAANAIINNENYEIMAKKEFEHKLKASVVNRFLWELFGDKSWIVNRIHQSTDPLSYLYSFHNFNRLQRLLYPIARVYTKKRYNNLRL